MSDFALFTCKKEEPEQEKPKSIFQYFYKFFARKIKEPDLEDFINEIALLENVNACILKIPYTIDKIGVKTSRIAQFGEMLKSKYSNITCITPKKFSGIIPFEGCISNVFTGKVLFKSLLIQIIDEIYTKKNIEISALDITIIHGESYQELYAVLYQLAPYVKFITIITEDRERVEEDVDKIYYDTGLSVRVTNEYRSGMKSADLIINFADDKEFVFNTRINPRALIINYGSINFNKLLSGNIIINGIEVGMPSTIYSKFDKEIFEYYNRVELAEIILSHKTFLSGKLIEGLFDFDLSCTLSEEFKKTGFHITGFAGRRNMFKVGDIKLYGT
jgi:hypothetical protein